MMVGNAIADTVAAADSRADSSYPAVNLAFRSVSHPLPTGHASRTSLGQLPPSYLNETLTRAR
jgi:hypothetical protein